MNPSGEGVKEPVTFMSPDLSYHYSNERNRRAMMTDGMDTKKTVSYTHLTLPTICSV